MGTEEKPEEQSFSNARRRFLHRVGLGVVGLVLPCSSLVMAACVETEDNIEGPFYKPGSPERSNLIEPGMPGTRLSISGSVLGADCEPLAGAPLDVWQADDTGQYDNKGFLLRGRLHTDKSGRFRLDTVIPKRYRIGGSRIYRPAHIHVKVRAPGYRLLTTQLYFPNDPYNTVDTFFRPSLVITPKDGPGGKVAQFDFGLRRL